MKKIILFAASLYLSTFAKAQDQNLIQYSNASSGGFIDAVDIISGSLPYPNPTTGALHLDLEKPSEVFIYNANGLLVMHQKLQRGKYTLDLSAQPTGLYFMNLIALDNSGVENHRINKF
ncbi:MAG: T9SS type A sorting domain-containing protein [Chitinophagaceae bacterium]